MCIPYLKTLTAVDGNWLAFAVSHFRVKFFFITRCQENYSSILPIETRNGNETNIVEKNEDCNKCFTLSRIFRFLALYTFPILYLWTSSLWQLGRKNELENKNNTLNSWNRKMLSNTRLNKARWWIAVNRRNFTVSNNEFFVRNRLQ